MLGRGVDQIFAHPSVPRIHEPWARSALDYVHLAETANGPIPRRVGPSYVWGDALAELERLRPHWRIANLETSITASESWEPKGINYRMHPGNIACLGAAGIDCCTLANNHVLDWGRAGLLETLGILRTAGIASAGAGADRAAADAPAILDVASGARILVFAVGERGSGIRPAWAATADSAGVAFLDDLSVRSSERLAARIKARRQPRDLVIVSIHWGGNWGYPVPLEQRRFAHALLDSGTVDVVHGHSSHHPKAIEIHGGKPVLYGCGDFLNDYEGISGHEEYRPDLVLMYLLELDVATRTLVDAEMVPLRIRKFQLGYPAEADVAWMAERLNREYRRFGTGVNRRGDRRLELLWPQKP
jgi:poly-gamma-glutamate synthesis protein (capsule biosynthesis protein)